MMSIIAITHSAIAEERMLFRLEFWSWSKAPCELVIGMLMPRTAWSPATLGVANGCCVLLNYSCSRYNHYNWW